jgi:hypothetical protein
MKPNEILGAVHRDLAVEVIGYAHANDREVYRAALAAVAQALKVRPVFLERQPRAQQHATMASALTRRSLEAIADSLIRAWLLKKHTAVLTDFLDSLQITHDKGVVENLPETMADEALKAAVDALLAKHPAQVVAVYLHAFNYMNEAKWPNLDTLLQNDNRLLEGLLQGT